MNEHKNKIHKYIHAPYMTVASNLKTQTDWKGMEKVF